ncbi:hypothetical protein ACJ41O_006506 [Fusarium nematophilum]
MVGRFEYVLILTPSPSSPNSVVRNPYREDECLFESANLAFVQALILLSNLSQKPNKPNTGSNFLGLATRMALSLGLHRELPGWNIGLLQREMRRRVWWGLYMFDRGASTTFGRPILLPDTEAMDVRSVLNIHDEYLTSKTELPPTEIDLPTLYSGMKYQSDLHVKSNHISNSLLSSSGVSPKDALSMDATLDRWSETLPIYLRLDHDSPIAEPSFLFNRSRLWWRFWNLKIILFRQLLLRRVVDKGNGTAARVNQLDDKCRSITVHAASATTGDLVLESPDLPRWQEELNTARHIFRTWWPHHNCLDMHQSPMSSIHLK